MELRTVEGDGFDDGEEVFDRGGLRGEFGKRMSLAFQTSVPSWWTRF